MFTPSANPSLSFPLAGESTVETRAIPEAGPSQAAQLTRRLAAGDEAAFRQFHAQYFDRLYRFLLVVTRGQEHEAQEALQHTLLRVVRYIRVFESEDVFWGWLKALGRSAACDTQRRQRRYSALLHKFALGLAAPVAEGRSHEEDVLSAALAESLAELPSPDRRLLEAKYIAGCTVKELGCQTGMTAKAVESRLERLRRTLRERVLKKLASP